MIYTDIIKNFDVMYELQEQVQDNKPTYNLSIRKSGFTPTLDKEPIKQAHRKSTRMKPMRRLQPTHIKRLNPL